MTPLGIKYAAISEYEPHPVRVRLGERELTIVICPGCDPDLTWKQLQAFLAAEKLI